jgi:AbrB family looped-hinge helix DNA binding protein
MPVVAVKNKFQVVIPQRLRDEIGIQVGDLLEARVERGKITFTPKSLLDRRLAESFADFKEGRSYGPFASAAEAAASMRKQLRARRKRKS